MKNISNSKKNILLSVSVILIGILVTGLTYATISMVITMTNGNYVANTLSCFDIGYDITNEDGTMDITGTLNPSVTYEGGLSGRVSMGIDPDCTSVVGLGNIYLNIVDATAVANLTKSVSAHCETNKMLETLTDYDTAAKCASYGGSWVTDGSALKYLIYDVEIGDAVSSGYIKSSEDVVNLYKNFNLSYNGTSSEWVPRDYDVYIWLDGNLIDNSYLSSSFSGYISADAIQADASDAPVPELDENMIPVVIRDDGTVVTVSPDDPEWYDYRDQRWANAVLIKENSSSQWDILAESTNSYVLCDTLCPREEYINNLEENLVIPAEDILAYYVWIPRYKYKIWTTEAISTDEQSIEIMFESKDMNMTIGSQVGEYMTHPAFWWDDDNDSVVDDGEMLAGIWVGKFESSASEDTTCYKSPSQSNCNNSDISPRILPNKESLRLQSISNQFTTSRKFSASGNAYGLSNTNTNAHIMKSVDNGAVAYLSHSIYGINRQVRINNNANYVTGCGSGLDDDKATFICEIKYGNGLTYYPQSTTGNISGIFDMNGGSWEQVMTNYNGSLGASGFTQMPESKYYEKFTISSLEECTLDLCGGRASFETIDWYDDFDGAFVNSYNPWLRYGGGFSDSGNAGLFYVNNGGSVIPSSVSWRSVLVMGHGD